MAANFPNSPNTNDTFTSNGVTFTWNGEAWKLPASPGVKGTKGEIGVKGEKGQKGEKGEKGQKGEVGLSGGAGGKGEKGEKGQKGQNGNDATGTKGQKGEVGQKGQKGDDNSTKGQKGEIGVADKGQKGEVGTTVKGQKGELGNVTAAIPSGGIIIWSGAANAIPSGWYLCDGNNSTPDLRSRFVVGASASGGFSVGNTGGSKDAVLVSHTHNLSNHVHGFSASTDSQGAHTHTYSSATQTNRVDNDETHQYLYSNTTQNTGSAGAHTHTISGNTGAPSTNTTDTLGESATNKNLPPYYALIYIIKT